MLNRSAVKGFLCATGKSIFLIGIFILMALIGLPENSLAKSGSVSISAPVNGSTISSNFNVSFNATFTPIQGLIYAGTASTYPVNTCTYTSYYPKLDFYHSGTKDIVGKIVYSIDGNTPITLQDVYSDSNNTSYSIPINISSLTSGSHSVTIFIKDVYSTMNQKYYGGYSGSGCLTTCTTSGCHVNPNIDKGNGSWQRQEGSLASATVSFTKEIPITASPSLTYPPNRFFTGSISGSAIDFQWGTVPNATSYRILFSTDPLFITSYQSAPASNNQTWYQSMQPIVDKLGKYYWAVMGFNSFSSLHNGPWSETRTFINGPSMECFPEAGSGNGNSGTQSSHIDTCYNLGSTTTKYLLKDITRRANMNVDGHNGNMANSASIITKMYGAISPLNNAVNNWSQTSAVDAHVNTAKVYDYLNSRFYDPPPAKISNILYQNVLASMVESEDGLDCPQNFAFYNPDWTSPITVEFCKGTSSSSSLDIVAHEWTHAVTDLASNHGLLRNREAGALNEAFSDWMATAIKHANNDNSWIITISANLNRNLSNPLLSKPAQPVWYDGANWLYCRPSETPNYNNDMCGIHQNTGVPNQMFYLLSQSIGIEKAIQIAYKANTERWKTDLTFADARDGMIWAAGQLYGLPEVAQVDQAWAAVGVTPTSTPVSLTTKRFAQILTGLLLND